LIFIFIVVFALTIIYWPQCALPLFLNLLRPQKTNGSKSTFTTPGACSKQGKGTSTSSANAAR
jgi:hypothetical protein